jgi:hypothetical protein
MRSYGKREEVRTVQILKSITCDKSEKEILLNEYGNVKGGIVSFSCGYGSRYDLLCSERINDFDICDNCIEEIFSKFKGDVLKLDLYEDK